MPDFSALEIEIDTTERDKAIETAAATKATAEALSLLIARNEELAKEAEVREGRMLTWTRVSSIAAIVAAILALVAIVVTLVA